ncbi:MAG: methyltransferase family protein [Myxococcota bacterium]
MSTHLLACALLSAFLFLAFGLRTLLHRRATGDWGFRGLSGPVGSAGWWGGLGFVVAMLAGPLALTLEAQLLAPRVGAVLALTGLVLTLVAQAQMRQSWRIGVRPGERTPLVTTGLFALVRNPVFSGMLLFSVGLLLLWPNAVSLVATAALLLGVELQVRFVEEPALRTLHGAEWSAWAQRVGRFVPRLGLAHPPQRRIS